MSETPYNDTCEPCIYKLPNGDYFIYTAPGSFVFLANANSLAEAEETLNEMRARIASKKVMNIL